MTAGSPWSKRRTAAGRTRRLQQRRWCPTHRLYIPEDAQVCILCELERTADVLGDIVERTHSG